MGRMFERILSGIIFSVFLISIIIIPYDVIALGIEERGLQADVKANKPYLEMQIYDYTVPDTGNPLGIIGDAPLVEEQLLLPTNNYMLKLRLVDNGSGAFSKGVFDLSTYISYDSTKIKITANSNSSPDADGHGLITDPKDKEIFDSGLLKTGESITSFKKGYFENFVNVGVPNDLDSASDIPNRKILSISQSSKDGGYGDGSKHFKADDADNVLAAITFSVSQNAVPVDVFELGLVKTDAVDGVDSGVIKANYTGFNSDTMELSMFSDTTTGATTTYNDLLGVDDKKYSTLTNPKAIGRNIGEPRNIALSAGNDSDDSTKSDIYVYYKRQFRDTGYRFTDRNGTDYSKYYTIERTIAGANPPKILPNYSINEIISNLSDNPNVEQVITYLSSNKGTGKKAPSINRTLHTKYLRGDSDNDGFITKKDDHFMNLQISRNLDLSKMVGNKETIDVYKIRAFDLNFDSFVTANDRFVLNRDINRVVFIPQIYSYIVPGDTSYSTVLPTP